MKGNISLIIFAILSVAGLWFVKSPSPAVDRTVETKPQEYMKHVTVSLFTEDGFLKSKLSAADWTYLSNTAISTLHTPHLTVYKPDGTLWLINAQVGTVVHQTLGSIEEIVLKNNVTLECPADKKAVPIKLETHEIRYQPKKQYVESDQWITMTKPGITITGRGLRAFLEQNSVELLHDVKTHYILTHQ